MIKKITTDNERDFAISYWLDFYRKSSPFAKAIAPSVYFDEHKKRALECLKANAYVYVDPKDMDHYLGFICGTRGIGQDILHFAYVKKSVRGIGIGAQMAETLYEGTKSKELIITHQGEIFGLKNWHEKVIYNPYKFLKL